MERVHRFSRINLISKSIASLYVLATYAPTDERLAALDRLSPRQPEFPPIPFVISQVSYSLRGGNRHVVTLVVARPGTPMAEDGIAVYLTYGVNQPIKLPKSNPFNRGESDVWAVVAELGVPDDLSGGAEFLFPGRGGADLWFPLPAALAGGRDPEDVFELRSVSGVKKGRPDVGSPGYRFTLSCPFGKDVHLHISFDLEGPFEPSIARTVQRRAIRLVPDLVP